MPIVDLRTHETTVYSWDVLFQFGYGQPEYVDHLGLFGDEQAQRGVTSKTNLPITHVQPCLLETHSRNDFIGTANLSEDERLDVAVFVEGVRNEKEGLRDLAKLVGEENARRRLFRLYPCYSPGTDDFAFRRFSCVGFVIMAYDAIRIPLLSSSVPDIFYSDLLLIECDDLDHIRDAETRDYLGISDTEPMAFIFPGYVLHAMNRPADVIRNDPYSPHRGDEHYPSKANTTA